MASRDRLALEAHPAPQQLLTDTDLGGHVSHWAAGLNHQAGSLLPKLRGVLATLARHTDILPAGPVVPPVRCPPSGVNPNGCVGHLSFTCLGPQRCKVPRHEHSFARAWLVAGVRRQ